MTFSIPKREMAEMSAYLDSYLDIVKRDMGDELIRRGFYVMAKATKKEHTDQAEKKAVNAFWRTDVARRYVAITNKMTRATPKDELKEKLSQGARFSRSSIGFIRAGWLGGMLKLSEMKMEGKNAKPLVMKAAKAAGHMAPFGGALLTRGAKPSLKFYNATGAYKAPDFAREELRRYKGLATPGQALMKIGPKGLSEAFAAETASLKQHLLEKMWGIPRQIKKKK